MSTLLLFSAVRIHTSVAGAVRNLAARLADDERGQDTIEYLGVLLVVAALISIVVLVVKTNLQSTIETGATNLINSVFSAGSSTH